jgi:predicted RNase H-like nuclease (RuvC/YqgF family)
VDIVVGDFTEAANDISAVAEGLGGYTVSSHITERAAGAISGISIRVPAERLDEALQAIRELAVEVKTLDTSSQDITEEFTDLQAQLRNLEAGEAQFLELMEKAKTVEEILQVQRELNNIRGQIERVKGRIKYLEGNVRESLITVTLRLSPEAKPVVAGGWSIIETFRSAARGLVNFGRVLVDVAVWLAIFSPVWVALGLGAFYLRRKWQKARP